MLYEFLPPREEVAAVEVAYLFLFLKWLSFSLFNVAFQLNLEAAACR